MEVYQSLFPRLGKIVWGEEKQTRKHERKLLSSLLQNTWKEAIQARSLFVSREKYFLDLTKIDYRKGHRISTRCVRG